MSLHVTQAIFALMWLACGWYCGRAYQLRRDRGDS
jgi:hypothetical protein